MTVFTTPLTPWRTIAGVLAVLAVTGLGVIAYLTSPPHTGHDPVHSLQQLDLFYLDQPAPLAAELGLVTGLPALVVVCRDCSAPALASEVRAQVVVSDDLEVARAYALARSDGRIGPGYGIVDAKGRLRYRTFDPGVSAHAREIGLLLRGLP